MSKIRGRARRYRWGSNIMKGWDVLSAVCVLTCSLMATPAWAYQDEKEAATIGSEENGLGKKAAVLCENGLAGTFPCQNVHLIGFLSLSELGTPLELGLNDGWGWTDPDTDHSYFLVGREDGLAFVDVTTPESPVYVGELLRTAGTFSTVWRDVKTNGYYAYVVADGAGQHGMQVFDLRKLRTFAGVPITFGADAMYNGFGSAHNIAINEESNRAYIVGLSGGPNTCGQGLHIVDIQDPLSPVFKGCFAHQQTGRASTGYTHDTQCVIYRGPDTARLGREICFSSNETAFSISDVTNPAQTIPLSKATYPGSAYVHQGWLTEDQAFFVQNDELDESAFSTTTTTYIWDVSDLDDPILISRFESDVVSIDHNLYIRNGFAYQANYTSGLRIMDVRDPFDPSIVGSFDTTPENNTLSFDGAWTAYPFPNSEIVAITSRGEGLFLVKPSSIVGTRFKSGPVISSNNGDLTISWEMVAENDVDRYEIEQQNEAGPWQLVASTGIQAGVGNKSYVSHVHVDPGVYRFRIAARSPEGGVVFTEEEQVVFIEGSYRLDAPFPNPVSNAARSILIVEESQQVQVGLYNAQGQRVQSIFNGLLQAGTVWPITIETTAVSPGIYFLRVNGEKFQSVKEIVVLK